MFISNDRAREKPPGSDSHLTTTIRVPLVADIAAGTGIEAYSMEPSQILTIDQSLLSLPGPYWAFRVEGDSMEPSLTTDDIAIVTRSWHEIDYNGMICAFRSDSGLLIKRVHIAPKAKYGLLIPINPRHQILHFDKNSPDIIMLGILVASIRLHNNT
jgi:SOS-response transcriptional repressor LexA